MTTATDEIQPTKILFVIASNVPDTDRLIRLLPNATVCSYHADFAYIHRELTAFVSQYSRGEFARACWITRKTPPGVKVNFIANADAVPEPFFRYLLDTVAPYCHRAGVSFVDVLEVDPEPKVHTTFKTVGSEWAVAPKVEFSDVYFPIFSPPPPATSATNNLDKFKTQKVVWTNGGDENKETPIPPAAEPTLPAAEPSPPATEPSLPTAEPIPPATEPTAEPILPATEHTAEPMPPATESAAEPMPPAAEHTTEPMPPAAEPIPPATCEPILPKAASARRGRPAKNARSKA